MKKFLRNKKMLLSLVAVILSLTLITTTIALRNNQKSPNFVQKFGNDTIAIIGKIVNWPVSFVSNGVNEIGDLLKTYQQNDYLKSKVDDLAQTKARNSVLEDENKELKDSLKLKDTLSDYDLVVGSVISRSPATWSDILIIDQGSSSGIKKNMAVMAGKGLIGRVVEVNHTTSKIELITTTDKSASRFSVEGKLDENEVFHGIINGYDQKNGNLLLSQVEENRKIKKGTEIYTSGLGGQSPRGLLVGKVAKTSKDSFGLSDVVQIKPAANLGNFTVVTVIVRDTRGEDDAN